MFSFVSTVLACDGNPRNIGSWKENAFIVTSWAIYISGMFFYGLGLSRLDEGAVKTGKMNMMLAAFLMIMLPALLYGLKLFSGLSDAKLSSVMLALFQSVPSILGTLLYVASSSFRCILQSDEKLESVVDQCGNPMQPASVDGAYLMLAWGMGYSFAPIAPDASKLSWKNVMELKMTTMQFTLGGLFSTLSIIALVMFANTNENGTEYDDFLQLLVTLFYLVIVVFYTTVIFDLLAKPRFFRGATTNDVSQRDNSGKFGMHNASLAPSML